MTKRLEGRFRDNEGQMIENAPLTVLRNLDPNARTGIG